MKTLYYPEYRRLEIADLPRPQPGDGEVLLRVAAVGICGSELEAYKTESPRRIPPLILGHEFCGVVEDVGPSVTTLIPGQRVVSHSLFGCSQCVRCRRGDEHICAERQLFSMHRPGAFAEFVTAPEKCLVSWPAHLPAQAASLAEPLANGVHVVGLSRYLKPQTVVILGAGPIGLFCLQAFRCLTSAEVIVSDLIEDRLEVATRLGARQIVNSRHADLPTTVLDLTGGEGADVVVDAVGSRVSKQQSLAALKPGGVTVWIGLHEDTITIDSFQVTLGERRVQGSYAASLDDLKVAVSLLASGQVDATSWVKTFPLTNGVDAFHRMLAARGDDIKAVLLPGE
jgi:L-iditol 2-dehydrogenase